LTALVCSLPILRPDDPWRYAHFSLLTPADVDQIEFSNNGIENFNDFGKFSETPPRVPLGSGEEALRALGFWFVYGQILTALDPFGGEGEEIETRNIIHIRIQRMSLFKIHTSAPQPY
jgi:hypothetical protein